MCELELKVKKIIYDLYDKCSEKLLEKIKVEFKENDFIRTGEKRTITIYLSEYILNDNRCYRYNVKKGSLLQEKINFNLCSLYEELLRKNNISMYHFHAYEGKKFSLDIFTDECKYKREGLRECIRVTDKCKFLIKYHFDKKKLR